MNAAVIPLHPFKTCGCGKSFTKAEWNATPLLGLTDCHNGAFLVLRNCDCGSTIGIMLDARIDAEWLELTGVLAEMAGLRKTA